MSASDGDRRRYRIHVTLPSMAVATGMAAIALLLPVPGVLVGPIVYGAGYVSGEIARRRLERIDAVRP
jgi:hypothetical protein